MESILVICGPTASGKTSLAIECAKMLNTEIISADSQQIYKNLDIGTAKPSLEERQGVIHHMIDVAEPSENFSVSDYKTLAEPVLQRLISENKTPIICGGTGFYINSLLFDLSYGNVAADESVRKKYADYLDKYGKEKLFELLKQIDPQTAEVLNENDVKRVIRALEIYEVSGKKKSEQADEQVAKYDYLAVAIDYPREELYERIDKRVDQMFENGLVDEVENLLKSGIDENYQCMAAIGYKEVVGCLKNGDLDSTMRDIIKLNTRHYAKRQITFFKKMKNLIYLSPKEATAERVAELLNEHRKTY